MSNPAQPLAKLVLKKSNTPAGNADESPRGHIGKRHGLDAVEAFFFASPPDYQQFD